MTTRKRRAEHALLFGMPALRPEWEAQRDDAREREIEKTQTLRAARLAAQQAAGHRVAPAPPKNDLRTQTRDQSRRERSPLLIRRFP